MSAARGFDWPALLRVGLSRLGLPPDQFWALTPAELQLMLGPKSGPAPLLSDGLAALMSAYPDETKGAGDG
ncbi:rcc01693 family protein [Sulfitobacter sp. 1A12779]|uniref:rcc01693 family protein n=1 Tax=Sulfitobacter sp. 1A12779 TaxID=3368599 RepID=UPI0037454544